MKKVIISLLLILSLIMTFASCDMLGKKDNPEKNVDRLVSALNEGTNFEEIKTNAEAIDVNELLDQLKTAALEVNLSGTVEGETGNAYLGLKDKVLYISSAGEGEDSEESYVFIEDDWTLVSVSEWNGEYYGSVETGLKDIIESLGAIEDEETTTAPKDDEMASDAMSMIGGLLDAIMKAELPEASAEDVEYKDGKYYLDNDYIKSVLDKYIDVVFEELGEMGMPQSELLDYKAAIKGYLDYITVEMYYYIDREEITGIGMSVTVDKTFASEKIGYSDIAVSFEICKNRVALDLLIANGDDVLADINAAIDFTINKNDKLETIKLDVNAKVTTTDYEWDEESFEPVETVNTVNLEVKLDANLVDLEKGNGEFLTFTLNYSDGENVADVSVKADSSDKGDKLSCEISVTAQEDGETQTSTLNLTANMKAAPNMPTVPQGAIDARDDAIEDYNNGTDWWY